MISFRTAEQLLDMGARIGDGERARAQLAGAVAIHNILEQQGVAYLADEVGMGKTYVALGAVALFRHFNPGFRVLFIAPRENIQQKWMKEFRNFIAHNVRFPDLRVKGLDGRSTRPLISCENLLGLVHEASLNPDRDFFARLSSFSIPLSGEMTVDRDSVIRLRNRLMDSLPWLEEGIFDFRRRKQELKDDLARAICCALPRFDLVVVDEAHNLKHGFGESVAARNRVLAMVMGHPLGLGDRRRFPGYGPRATRVLFLSATPVEETYRHLWNQLNVFARGNGYEALRDADRDEDRAKEVAKQFLIRRVTSISVAGIDYTKNQYRREWLRGGVQQYDEPIRIDDDRQKLVIALIQKKVSEILGNERFNRSFQIGMLASFESFLETARLTQADGEESNFDGTDVDGAHAAASNAEDIAMARLTREGIDVSNVNQISGSYRRTFNSEMPHPKMDALVAALSTSWNTGRKALVFVRRVASVRELKRRLDDAYDAWLLERLGRQLPNDMNARLSQLFGQYQSERTSHPSAASPDTDTVDNGGTDTFFAWFFRGQGPKGIVSGATIQQRFIQKGTAYSTFFEDNYLSELLGCEPGEITPSLAAELDMTEEELRTKLRDASKRFLTRAKKPARGDRFEAVQAAAIELLREVPGLLGERARIVWHQRFEYSSQGRDHAEHAPEIGDILETPTFFTELRKRPELRLRIWPESSSDDPSRAFRERELRRQLLASAARLGHAFVDLYAVTMRHLQSFDARFPNPKDETDHDDSPDPMKDYLDLLEAHMNVPQPERTWAAYDELSAISDNFEMILDVNDPDAQTRLLTESAREFGVLLGKQQPTGGMSGEINRTLVRQFRMPGYPLVLITTDILQEGEDLHTFCSDIHHYGISWTPSSMEQRIGRIDRVRSQTDRRLGTLTSPVVQGTDKLQVYYPYLEDTVEVLQVDRVLARMQEFLRLMHENLVFRSKAGSSIDTSAEMPRGRQIITPITEHLKTAFPVREELISGELSPLAAVKSDAEAVRLRFSSIASTTIEGLMITWENQTEPGVIHGTIVLGERIQPLTLLLRSVGKYHSVRCISPIGSLRPDENQERLAAGATAYDVRIGAILTSEIRTYDLTIEDEVLLSSDPRTDGTRIGQLILRVARQADLVEQKQLPGKDEHLATFRKDLDAEVSRDR